MIDKDTVLCGSFAEKAGSFGCKIHNEAFRYLGLNFIYKSFAVADIGKAVESLRVLKMRGAGITMPYKVSVLNHVDEINGLAYNIGAANTIVNDNGKVTAYNTDYIAARTVLEHTNGPLCILGRGGYARAVAFAAMGREVQFITRDNWSDLEKVRNHVVFNCTPVKCQVHESNKYIDASLESDTGKKLALLQAAEQFRLYTGQEFPLEYIRRWL